MNFLTHEEKLQLQKLLISNRFLQTADAQGRRDFLSNCGLLDIANNMSFHATSEQFIIALLPRLLTDQIIIDHAKRLSLVIFLEHLLLYAHFSQEEIDFVNYLIQQSNQLANALEAEQMAAHVFEFPFSENSSTFVPNMQLDVFISYAKKDDEALPGMREGWVSMLVNMLDNMLDTKLGNTPHRLWKSPLEDLPLPEQLQSVVEQSAIFIVILSSNYLKCEPCLAELDTFLKQTANVSHRTLIIEREAVTRPAILAENLSYKFLINEAAGNPFNVEYHQKLNDLTCQLENLLKSLKSTDDMHFNPAFDVSEATTVFLAEVTDDLEEQRDALKRYLNQQGIQVLPLKTYLFVPDIEQALEQDFRQCELFIQLLSDKTGKGYPQLQYETATHVGLPILQWRQQDIQLDAIQDISHRQLLSMCMTMGLVEFQSYILRQLQKTASTVIPENKWVFVYAMPEDMPLAYQIKDILEQQEGDIECTLPLDDPTAKPSEIRKYIELSLLQCHAVIILYFNTPETHAYKQILYCRQIQGRRNPEQPLEIIAVYHQPSENKPRLDIRQISNTQIFDCPSLQADTCLPQFLQALNHE